MRNEALIETLTRDLRPVRPAPRPARLLAVWLAISILALFVITMAMGPRADLATIVAEPRFLASEALAIMTAVLAAYAAFCVGRPDQPGWKLLLPVGLLLVWLAELGRQCLVLSVHHTSDAFLLRPDFMCIPAIAIGGLVPALAMVMLMRRNIAFRATHSCFCGALAATALAEAALRLFHAAPTFVSLLFWQMGSVALFTLLGSVIGRSLLGRPSNEKRPATS